MTDLSNLDGQIEAIGPIRPGDTLIIRVKDVRSRQHMDELVAAIKPELNWRLPDVDVVFLAGVDEILVYRPASGGEHD